MSYRERMEAKLEKRIEWATKADARSDARFNTAHSIVANIPLGQPILVGHHSEKRHRRDLDRMASNMTKGVEESKLADHHRSAASGLEHALDRSIFSDDENATDALSGRIAENEAKRERMKLINKLYRKGDAAKLAEMGLNLESLRERLNHPDVMSWCRIPYPAYELSNLGGRITADKKRLVSVKNRQLRSELADKNGGTFIENEPNGWCRVTFAEKPERSIIESLKAAEFWWSSGSWAGKRDKLPASVVALLPTTVSA